LSSFPDRSIPIAIILNRFILAYTVHSGRPTAAVVIFAAKPRRRHPVSIEMAPQCSGGESTHE
jgi:hypothetical protein